jgi:hypothetical protein
MKLRVSVEEMEAIVRNRVCTVCAERTVEGVCGTQDPDRCSLLNLFPLVAQAVLATESEEIEPYLQAIHENVCSVCVDQALDGTCPHRGIGCALDAYLPQVVEAIEQAAGRSLKREGLPQ